LQFNRARYLDQKTGRWTSQDPLGFDAGDENLYRYVFNSPTNDVDPDGLAVCFNKITIKDKGNGLGGNTLGNIATADSFGFGFDAKIEATVTGGDDLRQDQTLKKIKIQQYIFMLFTDFGRQNGQVTYDGVLADGNHKAFTNVLLDDASAALTRFQNDTYTYADDKTLNESILLAPDAQGNERFLNIKHEKDSVEYSDPTGSSGRHLPANKLESAQERLVIAIAAQGTDGKTLYAGFWVSLKGVSDDTNWKVWKKQGPVPELGEAGKTWTPDDDTLSVNKPPRSLNALLANTTPHLSGSAWRGLG
jgi:hypothetical protein